MTALLIIAFIFVFLYGSMAFIGAPYVPSKSNDVKKAFKNLYPLGDKDLLIDLGAGDGIVVQLAVQNGARAIGVELNPLMAFIARIRLRKYSNAQIICANYYRIKFPKSTTVIYTFGDSRDMDKLYRKVQSEANRLKKPLYFISYAFCIKGIKPTKKSGVYFLYLVEPEKSLK